MPGPTRHNFQLHRSHDAAGANIVSGLVPTTDGAGGWTYETPAGSLPWFDVTTYGATNDGTTDDLSAVNDAIAALNAADRGILYFPAGAGYEVSDGLDAITAGQVLILGDGSASFDYTEWGTSIVCTSGTAVLFTINSKIARIEHMGLLSSSGGAPSAGAAILADSAYLEQRVDFHDLHVRGWYDGIDSKVNAQWSMTDCIVTAPVRYGLRTRNTVNVDAGDGSIVNCNFYADAYNATSAIRQESSGGLKIANTKINMALSGHKFATGFDSSIGAGVSTSVLTIANCSIENVTGDAISIATVSTGRYGLISIVGTQVGLYTNNTGRAVKISAATNSSTMFANGSIGNAVIDGCTFHTDGTNRAAVELVNTNNVTLGDFGISGGFTSRYTSSGDTNTVDGSSGGEPTADAHIADAADAHDASAISAADAGGYFTAADVEGQLQEIGAGSIGYWEPVTNGDTAFPEIVFDDGDVVMEWVPG